MLHVVSCVQVALALRREGLPAPSIFIVSDFPAPQTPLDVCLCVLTTFFLVCFFQSGSTQQGNPSIEE